ncbi:MAG: hypothetical protein L0Z62_44235 [Gemmataceae bacterium]|nr:hypothetical protein [Gemmataceae bacterium]
MSRTIPRGWSGCPVALAALCVLLSGPPLTAQQPNGGREDLLPDRARWRTFPPDVRRVTVDLRGRPWFEIEKRVPRAELRRQVEQAIKLPAPWVAGARIVLLASKGRVWLRPDDDVRVLLGYDPTAGTWLERRVVPVKDRAGYDEKRPDSSLVIFYGPAYESKSGRLYFPDRLGVHVFDASRWSYQHLYRLNLERDLYYDSASGGVFDAPHYAEDDAGRVYVWTRWGRYGWTGTLGFFIHDGTAWTHRLLDPVPEKGAPRPKQVQTLNHVGSVVPLTDRRALICPEIGSVFVASVGDRLKGAALDQIRKDIALLGDRSFAVREAAYRRLARLDPVEALSLLQGEVAKHRDEELLARLRRLIRDAELALRRPAIDGHQFLFTRVHGVDARGNAWLWFDRCVAPNGKEERGGFRLISREGKVLKAPAATDGWYPDSMFADRLGRVYFARYPKGCVRFDGERAVPITDESQTGLRYVLGEDRDGRIYLTDERRVFAFLDGAPEERAALPTTIYEVPNGTYDVTVDSLGRVWAVVLPAGREGPAPLSVFAKGAWTPTPLPGAKEGVRYLMFFMPLKEGSLVAQDGSNRRVFFYDSNAWHEYPSLRSLVEAEYRRLVRRIDNRRWGHEYYVKLRVDGSGRIWLAEWTEGAVYDGKRWLDLKGPLNAVSPDRNFEVFDVLIPLPGGKGMLTSSRLTQKQYVVTVEGDSVKASPFKLPGGRGIEADTRTRPGLWIDSGGRIWLPHHGSACVRIDADGPRLLADTGYPRFEDSRGRVWLHNPYARKLVVLGPQGQRGELTDESLGESASLAEDAEGTLWVAAERGVLSVRVRAEGKGLVVERGKLYEQGTPRGVCMLMVVDREGALWFYGYGPQNNCRLYRIELPRGK